MVKKRVFVGVPFDEEARRGVEKILRILERKHWPVRWERVEKLHITLAFLGWIGGAGEILRRRDAHRVSAAQGDTADLKSVSAVSSAVESAVVGIKPFEVEFKGLGGFPDLELPRVIWVGLKGDLKSLARLYKEVRIQLENSGFKLEPFGKTQGRERSFVAHVTLGRIERRTRSKQRREIGKQIDKLRWMDILQKLKVDKVVVYESQLRRKGSEYKIAAEVPLG